jgi:hypothetical protein
MLFIYYTECFHICNDVFFFILMFQLIHNHQIEALNERVTVKKMLPTEPCVRAECYPLLSNKITAYIHVI